MPDQTATVTAEQHASLAKLNHLVEQLGPRGVSDFHAHPGKAVKILPMSGDKLERIEVVTTDADIRAWLAATTRGKKEPLAARGHASASWATENFRLRATFRQSMAGMTTTFRIIPASVPTMEQLHVPASIADLITKGSGLVIVEGPTGSGKTTLIASMIRAINEKYDKHIYIIEDPTEFVHEEIGDTSIVQREIGVHAADYSSAIEDALRSKPNVIVVGELLNPATAKAALHAATTGHLVFTTAHAGSVTEAIDGFIGQFQADEQPQIRTRLAQSLLAIIVQKLVPLENGGKAPARELLLGNPDFSELIRTGQTQMIRAQLAGQPGCYTLEHSLSNLVAHRAISEETALSYAKDHKQMVQELARKRLAVA